MDTEKLVLIGINRNFNTKFSLMFRFFFAQEGHNQYGDKIEQNLCEIVIVLLKKLTALNKIINGFGHIERT